MSSTSFRQPTEPELEILQVLWEHQPATVKFVHEQLVQHREVGYTTILKQMQRMFEKGMIGRVKEGKQHLYSASFSESQIQESLYNKLVKTAFKGSPMQLVMHALGRNKTSEAELEELQQWLDDQKKSKKE